jgi:hypothetical protein
MATVEDQRHLKQKFLRAEIIDFGLDAGEFAEYIGMKKENGRKIVIKALISTIGATTS